MICLGKFNMRSPAYLILPNVLTSLPPPSHAQNPLPPPVYSGLESSFSKTKTFVKKKLILTVNSEYFVLGSCFIKSVLHSKVTL